MKSLRYAIIGLFAAGLFASSCNSALPLRPLISRGTSDATASGIIKISIANIQLIKDELKTQLNGMHVVVEPMQGTVCANPTKVDLLQVFRDGAIEQSLQIGCDYYVGLELGTLDGTGTTLETVYFANRDQYVRGASILATDLRVGVALSLEVELSRVGSDKTIIAAPNSDKRREIVGLYDNATVTSGTSQQSIEVNSSLMTGVTPYWYTLAVSGNLELIGGGFRQDVIDVARAKTLKVMPFVYIPPENSGVLTAVAARDLAIDTLVNEAESRNYAGLTIGFGPMGPALKSGVQIFLEGLSKRMIEKKRTLNIAIPSKVELPDAAVGAFDYAVLNNYADRIALMVYDKASPTTAPGPVAPITWVEDSIRYALNTGGIPPEKLIIIVATFGYDWTAPGAAVRLSEKEVFALADAKQAVFTWEDIPQVPRYNYTEGNVDHTVYVENSYSLAFKLRLVEKYNIRGIGIYQLGGETDRVWSVIRSILLPK